MNRITPTVPVAAYTPTHHADILCSLGPMPSAEEWEAKGRPATLKLIAEERAENETKKWGDGMIGARVPLNLPRSVKLCLQLSSQGQMKNSAGHDCGSKIWVK